MGEGGGGTATGWYGEYYGVSAAVAGYAGATAE